MNVWKQNQLRKLMIKRRDDKENLKKVDSDLMIKNLEEKRKQSIQPNQLPF